MLTLRLLGDFTVECQGNVIRRFRSQKYSNLLAYLALHPDLAHSRDELIETFWPDEKLDSARTCLRTALSSLRRQLHSPDLFLDGQRGSIRVNPDRIETDVAAFEAAVYADDPAAPSLYKGPLLPACFDDWVFDERDRLQSLFENLGSNFPVLPRAATGKRSRPGHAKKSVTRLRSQLPSPITRFFGRQEELGQIARLMVEDQERLVTLTALGGMGKTRLAIEAGKRLPMRVAFVDLSDCRSFDEIPLFVADAFQLEATHGEDLTGALIQVLSTTPTCLILDNLEQVASKEACHWISNLLQSAAPVSILATSRIPLAIEGEQVVCLAPLKAQDAVDLFLDRARHVLPDYPVSPLLPDLCDRLDRMPLAIELCASWANVLSSKRMLEGLSARFELMRSRRRWVADRHQSLHAVLEWTCPPEGDLRRQLGMLSVMRGRWTLEAAEAILGDQEPRLFDAMCEKLLLHSEVVEEELRFYMLESVRDFAAEFLAPDEIDQARLRHFGFYSSLAFHARRMYPDRPIESLRILDAEHANIVAAIEFGTTADPKTLRAATELLESVRFIWAVRGHETTLDACIARVAARMDEPFDAEQLANVLDAAAHTAVVRGDFDAATEFQSRAVAAALTTGISDLLIRVLQRQASLFAALKDWDAAIHSFEVALSVYPRDDQEGYHLTLANLAGMYLHVQNDIEHAEPLYRRLLAFWLGRPNRDGDVAVMRSCLGACALARGRIEEAEALLSQAIPAFEKMGQTMREVDTLKNLALCLTAQGRNADAEQAAARIRFLISSNL